MKCMSHIERKPVFGVLHQIRHNLGGCTATEDGLLEAWRFRKKGDCSIYVVKTMALISWQLPCSCSVPLFFSYSKSRFSHDADHIFNFLHF